MTPIRDRVKTCRQRRVALGLCAQCGHPSDYGYYCFPCAQNRSGTMLTCVRRLRHGAREFAAWWLLLAENRCVACGQPKARFHDLQHKHCRPIKAA